MVDLLQEEHEEPSPAMGAREGRIKLFQGRQATMRNFREMVAGSEESIALVARVPLMIQDDDDVLEEALKRGVEVRILSESPAGFDFSRHEVFQRQLKLGCQARSLEVVPMRMGIFDRRIAILVLHEAGAEMRELMMLEVRNPAPLRHWPSARARPAAGRAPAPGRAAARFRSPLRGAPCARLRPGDRSAA